MKNTHQSILDVLDTLTPAKGRNRYHCPSCDGGAFTVDPRSGKYQCWHGCDSKEIWAILFPKNGQVYDHEKIAERRREREENDRLERERLENSLTPVERDREIRKILNSLELNESDRQYLEDRGLPDWRINQCRSLPKPWVKIYGNIDQKLAGVDSSNRLMNFSKGIYVPIANADGYFVGHKYRNLEDGAKYPWLSGPNHTGKTNKLNYGKDGQNPIGVSFPSVYKHLDKIGIVEGPEFKGPIASERLGYPVIAISGNCFLSYSEQILEAIPTIQSKAGLTPNLTIVTIPDSGMIGKNQGIEANYRKCAEFISHSGYTSKIAVWDGQDVKGNDIDEIGNLEAIAYRDPLEVFGSNPKGKGKLENFIDWVRQSNPLARRKRETPKGFKLPKPDTTYKKVERIDQWVMTLEEVKNLLACDVTGDGKTFDAGRLKPSMFQAKGIDIERIIYVTPDPRNASTETFKDWGSLSGRHNGLVVNPLGEIRRRKKNDLGTPYEDPNCSRCGVMEVLGSKNIPNHSDKKQLCRGCPNFEPCNGGTGYGYGYLKQRSDALSSDRIIAHPSSLPSPEDFDYSKTLIIIDEWDKVISNKKDVKPTIKDVNEVIARLAIASPSLWEKYREPLTRLRYLMGNDGKGYQHNRYGFTGQELRDYLVPLIPKDPDIQALREALSPDLSFLNPISEYGESIENLPREARKMFSDRDAKLAEKANETVLKQWFPEFLEVLLGLSDGYVNLAYGEMTISLPDNYLLNILGKSAKNILLSATGTKETFTQLFPDQTYKVVGTGNELIPPNIVFYQITDLGRLGKQRGKNQSKRLEVIKTMAREKYGDNLAVMDYKAHAQDGDLHHFTHSQGTNLAAGKLTLLICGTPCENLEALKHEFSHLYKKWPGEDDQGFKTFVHCKILKTFAQTIGRLRANRQLDKDFEVILATDYDLSELIPESQLVKMKASEFSPDAEDKKEKFIRLAKEAIANLTEQGQKVTQTAIANLIGYSQQYISRFWKLLQMLIDTNKAKVVKTSPSVNAQNEVKFLASEVLPQANDDAVLGFFDDVLKAYPENLWVDFWEAIPTVIQARILNASLAVTLKLAPE